MEYANAIKSYKDKSKRTMTYEESKILKLKTAQERADIGGMEEREDI